MILSFLYCAAGLVFLIAGGELLVGTSSRLASTLGMRSILIGLTVVAFGTSMPEASVSILASLQGKPDIAVSNVIGSNIFNIAFILGIAALIRPLKVEMQSLRREVPFVIGSSALVYVLASDRMLDRIDGMILLGTFVSFFWFCFRQLPDSEEPGDSSGQCFRRKAVLAFGIIASLLALVSGAKLLVSGASQLAARLGASELLIGLTIVAAGTSMPELAASVMASIRKKDDIAAGNVTGSNIFNVLFILGISALFLPLSVAPEVLWRDIPLMVLLSLAVVPVMKTGFVISRAEGALLVLTYIGYTFYLIFAESSV